MKKRHHIFIAILLLGVNTLNAQIQCVNDVVINEGTSIQMCEDVPLPISGSNGFVSYAWTGPETLAGQSITPSFSGQYIIAATDGVGCISLDTINVTINLNPTPSIVSSEGNPICPDPGSTTLSLSAAFTSYDWGGGNTGATFFAPSIGAYAVTVIDENGCTGHDVIALSEYEFSLTSTSISGCNAGSTTLTATGGASYLWSTSEIGNSIVVSPVSTTVYSVTITAGLCNQVLTATVEPAELLDYNLVDTLYMSVGEDILIEGPPNFDFYNWFPTGNISNPTGQNLTYTATTSEILTMQATHSSGCILEDSVVIIVVELSIPTGFSPNEDGYNEFFVIPELEFLHGKIQVWNRWGDLVLKSDDYKNTWNGTCQTSLCMGRETLPEGTYFYHITVGEITFDGFLTLKR